MSLLEGMVGASLSCPLFEFCIVNPFALPVLFLLLVVDATILDVLLIEYRIDPPLGSPIRDSAISIEYQPVAIAGRSYMLPFRSEVRMQVQSSRYVNTIDFRSYHKFAVESTVLP
jgi:hypothetical protein